MLVHSQASYYDWCINTWWSAFSWLSATPTSQLQNNPLQLRCDAQLWQLKQSSSDYLHAVLAFTWASPFTIMEWILHGSLICIIVHCCKVQMTPCCTAPYFKLNTRGQPSWHLRLCRKQGHPQRLPITVSLCSTYGNSCTSVPITTQGTATPEALIWLDFLILPHISS